jgi:hypothetical protein
MHTRSECKGLALRLHSFFLGTQYYICSFLQIVHAYASYLQDLAEDMSESNPRWIIWR